MDPKDKAIIDALAAVPVHRSYIDNERVIAALDGEGKDGMTKLWNWVEAAKSLQRKGTHAGKTVTIDGHEYKLVPA